MGYFVVSVGESSLGSVGPLRAGWLVSRGARGSRALDRLHSSNGAAFAALSLIKTIFLVGGLVFLGAFVLGRWDAHGGWLALAGLGAILVLWATRVGAKSTSAVGGERIALLAAPFAQLLARALMPALRLEAVLLRRSGRVDAEASESSEETNTNGLGIPFEDEGEPLDEQEVQMIRGVVRLDKTTSREIMVPRVDVVAVEVGASLGDLATQMVASGHSRIPVYEENLDRIQGIAYARDLVDLLNTEESETLSGIPSGLVRPALFIPESKPLQELLNELQERRVHIAIVVDEYGGVSGLVTIEDLLEEIVGEIQDEFDVGEPEIQEISETEFLMDARTSIDELDRIFQVEIDGDGFDTVGGFLYQRLGKIPSAGDAVEFDGLRIEVVSTVGRRLKKLRVVRPIEAESG